MKLDALGLPEEVRRGQLDAGSPRGTVSWTPLQFACAVGDQELTKELLHQPADPTACGQTKYAYSPLHIAVRYGHHAIVDLLVSAGAADILPVDAQIGASPLHLAVVRGDLAVVQRLLPVTKQIPETTNGTTPYELAKRLGHVEIAQLLVDHEQKLRSKQQLGDWLASIGMMEYLAHFQSSGFDDAQFVLLHGLSDGVLDAMKIDKPGHRLKLQSLYQLKAFLYGEPEEDEAGEEEEEDEGEDRSDRITSGEEGSEVPLEDESNSDESEEEDEEEEEEK